VRIVSWAVDEDHSGNGEPAEDIQRKQSLGRFRLHRTVLYHTWVLSSIAQHFDAPTNRLYSLHDQLRAKGQAMIDLVSGNVSSQGIVFPQAVLKSALIRGAAKARIYRPDPLGQIEARRAISQIYASEGMPIPPEQVIITPGTSISYWYAFKVLADSGDEILCPTPSYPLFDSIAALSGVKLVPYRLEERRRWEIDFEHLVSLLSPRTKAIVLISPHNPTGAVATQEEIKILSNIASEKKVAIISDEVFSPFLFSQKSLPRPAAAAGAPLVLTLNGFSKMLALPGLKIGWMAVTGEPSLIKNTLHALDMISDTFLPVNEAAQFAVPAILKESKIFQASYRAEISRRMELATDLLENSPGVSFIRPEGGFFLTLRLEGESADEEDVALQLLKNHRILVHPGYFYDMEGQHLVFSFVNRPAALRKFIKQIR
jgi:alanine-synthesizing transaminase